MGAACGHHSLPPPPHSLALPQQDGQVIRVSFSSLFKEFRSSATWLQFPFVFEARTSRTGDPNTECKWSSKGSLTAHSWVVEAQSGCYVAWVGTGSSLRKWGLH